MKTNGTFFPKQLYKNSVTLYTCTYVNSINRVTWHGGAIPDDEVWLKLGGDKGGGTFKFCFQHLNVSSPNAPENTCVFTLFEAPDTHTNLKIGLERYVDVLKTIESNTWRYNTSYTHACTQTYMQYYINYMLHIQREKSESVSLRRL